MVVAVVALSFALAGTAIAGPDALTSAITKSKGQEDREDADQEAGSGALGRQR
jgi:hypothetical protein